MSEGLSTGVMPWPSAPLRVITLRLTVEEFNAWSVKHLLYSLLLAWLAGIGRYWDNPRAAIWQHLGVGSVAYVFVLGAFLFLLLWPLRPQNWNFLRLVTMLSFTSPLAFLYSIPVERWMTLKEAASLNGWFLFIVAVWRVVIYGVFLGHVARLSPLPWFVSLFLPLASIVAALASLNLEHAVFEFMAGLREQEHTSADGAFAWVMVLACLSVLASPFLLLLYLCATLSARKTHEQKAGPEHEATSIN